MLTLICHPFFLFQSQCCIYACSQGALPQAFASYATLFLQGYNYFIFEPFHRPNTEVAFHRQFNMVSFWAWQFCCECVQVGCVWNWGSWPKWIWETWWSHLWSRLACRVTSQFSVQHLFQCPLLGFPAVANLVIHIHTLPNGQVKVSISSQVLTECTEIQPHGENVFVWWWLAPFLTIMSD